MFFEFRHAYYDDNYSVFFDGEEKNIEEFKKDCDRAMHDSFNEYIKNRKGWATFIEWIEFACLELEKIGYKRIKPLGYGYICKSIPKDISDYSSLKDFKNEIEIMVENNIKYEMELYNR